MRAGGPRAPLQYLQQLASLGYRISDQGFAGPWLEPHELQALGEAESYDRSNVYCVHGDVAPAAEASGVGRVAAEAR